LDNVDEAALSEPIAVTSSFVFCSAV
jgi:hypothetical protein